jgi:hypothetical protein
MKVSRLLVIGLLAGTLGAFGCSDDETNGGGSGGGGVTEPCTGGLCETADVKIDCEATNTVCKADANGDIGLSDAECDAAVTEFYCNIGAPGTGGAGGDGGGGAGGDGGGGAGGDGGGGAGGASGVEGCNEDLCLTNPERKAACEEFMPWCIEFCEGEGSAESCGLDECIGFAALFICNE